MGEHEEMRLVTEFSQTGRGPAHRNGHGPMGYLLPPKVLAASSCLCHEHPSSASSARLPPTYLPSSLPYLLLPDLPTYL